MKLSFAIMPLVMGLGVSMGAVGQSGNEIALTGAKAPIRIVRDSNSMPYIYAESLSDALVGQGFVAGQDRLYQMEVTRRAATGRLAEVLGAGRGEAIVHLDREARTIGFYRIAERQLAILSPDDRATLDSYLTGLNAYILEHADSHPEEFKLAGFRAEAWTATDLLSITFFLGWQSAANFDAELIAHKVIQTVGEEKFAEIQPVVTNPDDEKAPAEATRYFQSTPRYASSTAPLSMWTQEGWRKKELGGSNNWAMSGAKAGQVAAIVTNDPHLDSSKNPGPWHPVALITPKHRIVGASIGIPGIAVGRNQYIAFGATNAYADAVDLYIETIDPENPENYLEGEASIPLDRITEQIRIRDNSAPGGIRTEALTIRSTRRGPLITDHSNYGVGGAHISVRWATAEYLDGDLGLFKLMLAQDVDQALNAIENIHCISLNYIAGDVTGRVARRASGIAPVRLRGDGMAPFLITNGIDNWGGRIPGSEMPGAIDPEIGWVGSANHFTAPRDYPYVYTSYVSTPYRYRRMQELFSAEQVTAEDAWAAQYDQANLYARGLAPIFAAVLLESDEDDLRAVGQVLNDWDYHDSADALAPTLFQEISRQLAQQTFEDELGPEATKAYLSNWYVFQYRFDLMVQDGSSAWFDDTRTPEAETLSDLIRRAGSAALDRLTKQYGADQKNWIWGKVHTITFSTPSSGITGDYSGNRTVEMGGSGETLMRALYPYDRPFNVKWFGSLRMTADLSDAEKVRAVVPGGVVGRTNHPHLANQIDAWTEQDAEVYWWFSDEKIEADKQSTQMLIPTDSEAGQ